MSQNIYDAETFFQKYQALRQRKDNYNDLFGQPAMAELLPDITCKSVLDLDCGCGKSCMDFIKRGASKVVGLDLSPKMLEVK